MKVERRKLVKLGKSTLVVSLPSEWVKTKNLKAGDVVILHIGDNEIRVVPSKAFSTSRVVKIELERDIDEGSLYRIIVASYIIGADEIILQLKKVKDPITVFKAVRNATQHLIGMEVVKQERDEVILQSFIDLNKYPLNMLIKRIVGLLLTIISQIVRGASKDIVLDLENEIDKLYRLSIRKIIVGEEGNPVLLGVLVTSLESIADVLATATNVDEDSKKILVEIENILKEMDKDVLGMDVYKINELLDKVEELERKCLKEGGDSRVLASIMQLRNTLETLLSMNVNERLTKNPLLL